MSQRFPRGAEPNAARVSGAFANGQGLTYDSASGLFVPADLARAPAVGCRVRYTGAGQSGGSGGFGAAVSSFDTEDFDTDGFHSGTAGTITVPTGLAGKYLIWAQATCAAGSGDRQLFVTRTRSGSTTSITQTSQPAPSINWVGQVVTVDALLADDVLGLTMFQNSGSAKDWTNMALVLSRQGT